MSSNFEDINLLGADFCKPVAPRILQRPNSEPNTPPPERNDGADHIKSLEKEMEQLRLFQQSVIANNYGNQNRQYQNVQYDSGNVPLTESIPVNNRGYRWCGMNNHRKNSCVDYNKALREGMVHLIDEGDKKTRLGPMGSGGPIVSMQNRTLLSPAIHQMVDAENLTLRPGTNGFRNISLLQLLLSDDNAANRAFYSVEFWYERSGTATPPTPND